MYNQRPDDSSIDPGAIGVDLDEAGINAYLRNARNRINGLMSNPSLSYFNGS